MKLCCDFNHLAEQAVNAEQEGNYDDAVLFWLDASIAAQFRVNKDWAQARMAYCEHRRFRRKRSEKI